MKHIIIGTAGHIDHGKTTLIKALTGRETDTLDEEKKRGISINLGFTFFDLPSGKRAGIIDVPGHERFIKNMLAGISSVDMVVLVIAADEGIMPQTEEHFEILQLLNVKKGIIALTKCDLVDEEWIKLVKEDIKDRFKGTFLENAIIDEVSSKTGKGMDKLIKDIDKMTDELEEKDIYGHFRLPIDRVFSISGFGTIVTGTIISGNINVGEEIEVYPSGIKCKIRSLQVHEKDVQKAEAGQRCAINLSNVKVSQIERGNVISKPNVMESSYMFDSKIYYLKSNQRPLENRQRIRLHHGTTEILGRVVILDKEKVEPGEEAYIQFRLEEPITCQRNDRFVIRSYSPMHTIAGGSVIEPVAKKTKRFEEKYLEELKLKETGSIDIILQSVIKELSYSFPDLSSISKALGKNENNIKDELDNLIKKGIVIKLSSLDKGIYIHEKFINDKINELKELLDKFHKDNPLKSGIGKEEIKNKLFSNKLRQKNYDELLKLLENKKIVKINTQTICDYNFKVKFTNRQEKLKELIVKEFEKEKFNPPKYEQITNKADNTEEFSMVFEWLLDNDELIKISEDVIFLKKYYNEAKDTIIEYIKTKGGITPAEGREILNTNRKSIIALFESLDRDKITKRSENKRILYKN